MRAVHGLQGRGGAGPRQNRTGRSDSTSGVRNASPEKPSRHGGEYLPAKTARWSDLLRSGQIKQPQKQGRALQSPAAATHPGPSTPRRQRRNIARPGAPATTGRGAATTSALRQRSTNRITAFMQPHRMPIVLLHELLDGQQMRPVLKSEMLRPARPAHQRTEFPAPCRHAHGEARGHAAETPALL